MELLLFVIFILFSGFSALMGRRKRRKELEEAQKQQEARQQSQAEKSNEVEVPAARPAPPVVVVEEEKEVDPSFAWPFEGDPFEEFRPAAVDPGSLVPQVLEAARDALLELALGGTATGTGINRSRLKHSGRQVQSAVHHQRRHLQARDRRPRLPLT